MVDEVKKVLLFGVNNQKRYCGRMNASTSLVPQFGFENGKPTKNPLHEK